MGEHSARAGGRVERGPEPASPGATSASRFCSGGGVSTSSSVRRAGYTDATHGWFQVHCDMASLLLPRVPGSKTGRCEQSLSLKASICSVTPWSHQTWHPAGSGPGSLQGKGRKSHVPRPTPTPTPTEGRAPGRRQVRGRARFHSPSRPFSFPGGLQPPPGDRVAAPLGLASICNGRKVIRPGGSPLWKSLEFPRVPRAALWDGAGRDHGGRSRFLGHNHRVLGPSGEAGARAAWGRAGTPRDQHVRKWLAGSPRPRGARGPGNLTGSHRRPRSAVPGPGGSPGSGPPIRLHPTAPQAAARWDPGKR